MSPPILYSVFLVLDTKVCVKPRKVSIFNYMNSWEHKYQCCVIFVIIFEHFFSFKYAQS